MKVDVKRIEAVLDEMRREDLPVAVRSWRVEDTEDWAGDPSVFVWTLLEPGGILPGGKVRKRIALREMVTERLRELAGDSLIYVCFREAEAGAAAP